MGRKSVFLVFFTLILVMVGCTLKTAKKEEKSIEVPKLKIALVMKALNNPFFGNMAIGAKEEAKRVNLNLRVVGIEQETDVQEQISLVNGFIEKKYDAIILAPADSKALVEPVKEAIKKGIKVVIIDNPLDSLACLEAGVKVPFIGCDNYMAATLVVKYLGNRIKGGDCAIIQGIEKAENGNQRTAGFLAALTNFPQFHVVATPSADWLKEKAYTEAMKLLRQYPNLKVIICANDKMALGAIAAKEAMNRHQVVITGFDNIPEARDYILEGSMLASLEQHPEYMGTYGVCTAIALCKGQRVDYQQSVPYDLVTKLALSSKVGVSFSNTTSAFFGAMKHGVEKFSQINGIQVEITDAKENPTLQISQIDKLIKSGIDLLVVVPTNQEALVPILGAAQSKKIPIITADRSMNLPYIASHITSNNVKGGQMAAKYIKELLPQGARIVVLEGLQGTSAAIDRGKGFEKELALSPQYKIVTRRVANFDKNTGKTMMQEILDSRIQFNAVFAQNDDMAIGAILAMKRSNRLKGIKIVGFDGILDSKELIAKGEMSGSIAQDPENMGVATMQTALKILNGEKTAPIIEVPLHLVKK